ncbi:hypothetical protein [Ramlibacter rhizophilus]|uniref:Uncharacterized protein n=1 Tax=Ramlibacter rhizophilus TaxID=1781167 RepID=A0A4Z0BPD4_9BURK|nr:hypothetical protein [Ramlibacter rhizophilus]TFY99914.1 hypothetical protein EZ242_12325 [Ramlibacter rhizophilus]
MHSPLAQAFGTAGQPKGDDEWFMTLGGVSSHARETLVAGRQWNERHESFALERRVAGIPWNGAADRLWQVRYVAATLEDSRSLWGSYAGVALMREVAHTGTWRLHAGAYSSLYYKSTSWRGTMKLVPAVLPTLSLTDQRSGFGVNLAWVPPVNWAGRDTISTVLLQFNYRIEQ